MSPYQQDVIDATLADFDKQAAIDRRNALDYKQEVAQLVILDWW